MYYIPSSLLHPNPPHGPDEWVPPNPPLGPGEGGLLFDAEYLHVCVFFCNTSHNVQRYTKSPCLVRRPQWIQIDMHRKQLPRGANNNPQTTTRDSKKGPEATKNKQNKACVCVCHSEQLLQFTEKLLRCCFRAHMS
jgi:hypothetical protein